MRLDETARAEYLEKVKGCSVCTSPYHAEADCNSMWQKCGSLLSGDTKCQARHNRVLHGANSSYVINNLVQINNVSKGPEEHIEPRPVLLFIQTILLRGKFRTSLLYDSGSNYSLFPGVPKGALERPTDPVGILLGMDCADLMPTGPDNHTGGRQGNLVCMETVIGGQGFILGGSHPLIHGTDADMDPLVNAYKQAKKVDPPLPSTV